MLSETCHKQCHCARCLATFDCDLENRLPGGIAAHSVWTPRVSCRWDEGRRRSTERPTLGMSRRASFLQRPVPREKGPYPLSSAGDPQGRRPLTTREERTRVLLRRGHVPPGAGPCSGLDTGLRVCVRDTTSVLTTERTQGR